MGKGHKANTWYHIAPFALSNNIKSSCGISGDNLFDRDLGVTPEILGGKLSLPNLNGLGIILND